MNAISSNKFRPLSLLFFLLPTACLPSSADEIQTNQLPVPAGVKIDFDRDIQPIFQTICLRCHGPEKPKSHFRLDNRESALRGGDNNTNDIVPGDSLKSFLAHYVAREVPDMEMPPIGKGNPLTPQQVGLLRAWIDQGAFWNTTNVPPPLILNFEPAFRWIGVQGDKSKFRELEGRREGLAGGAEDVLFSQQTGPNEKFSLEGHFIVPDQDYRLKLALDETDQGFVHAGFDEWRKYYDDRGGYDPAAAPPSFNLNRDLYVDNGRIWVDLGLTLPRWPQIVLGYEYQFKNGNKSMLDWGQANGENVNIAPATKAIDEQTHILKLDVTHDFNQWHLEDNARVEFYTERNRGDETNTFNAIGATETQDRYRHVQGMNTLMLEKPVRDWWFLSGGFYYSRLEGTDFFNQTNAVFGVTGNSGAITLRRESEIFSVASLFTPLDYLSLSLGTQNEWTREEGFGNAPDLEFSIPLAFESANLDKFKSSQNADLRFTKIPFTVLFAGAQLEQESIDEFQQQEPTGVLTRRTDATNDRYNLRAGFNTSPWRWSALSAQYQRRSSDTDYHHLQDVWGNPFNPPTNGYPAFILGRKILTDEFETKLDLRPARWLKATLTCQLTTTDYSTKTDPAVDPISNLMISPGGQILAGKNDAQTFGAGVSLTPLRQLYFSGAFTYSQSRLTTASHGDPSVVPYDGNVYTVIATASYALNPKTALLATYNFSRADYGQNNPAGVPLGIDFTRHQLMAGLTRRFNQRVSGSLRYGFSQYSESSSGNVNNFTAHGIFATLDFRWP
ncbi:MAG: c-type cytochrome domain-containing protein [Verrucomicrobiota bacterium]|jgi:hypothetical protein